MGSTGTGTGAPAVGATYNLQTVIDRARRKLDNYEEPYFWVDQELVDYANETLQTIHYDTGYLQDSSTSAYVTLTLADGTRNYALSTKIIKILTAKISTATRQLTQTTLAELIDKTPDWINTDEGEPTEYMLDYQDGYITFYPTPDATYTVNMTVTRYNTSDFTTTNMSSQTVELPIRYINMLVDGIVYMACLKSGPNTYRSQQAKEYFAMFNNALAKAKRDNIRFNSKPTYQRPHNGSI